MSVAKNRLECDRWLLTAEEDLRAAEVLAQAGACAQACFYTQQSGEKAVKALWYLIDASPWGHSVKRLLLEFPERQSLPDIEQLLEDAGVLDQFYIPTRYPNGLPDLTPGQTYISVDAQRGLQAARRIVVAGRAWVKQRAG